MAKKLPKNLDLAAGFFSKPAPADKASEEAVVIEKITAPATVKEATEKEAPAKPKNLGGRPKKDGLKNEQFTLTMNPETYEKLRIIAEDRTRGNFSALIDDAIKSYCRETGINLADVKVDEYILKMYRTKQAKKSKKK